MTNVLLSAPWLCAHCGDDVAQKPIYMSMVVAVIDIKMDVYGSGALQAKIALEEGRCETNGRGKPSDITSGRSKMQMYHCEHRLNCFSYRCLLKDAITLIWLHSSIVTGAGMQMHTRNSHLCQLIILIFILKY